MEVKIYMKDLKIIVIILDPMITCINLLKKRQIFKKKKGNYCWLITAMAISKVTNVNWFLVLAHLFV